ncbi:FOG: Armadillo/beta-catenin-like repeats [Plasmopara halstedii]|uniref:FOG: Armadillo/beta-catenin-like repeats n=1 Tax=Plasmopara halstedii TaxID=4781 RepID=A0A0P1AAF8_PLAHL|nr:FOG: Armadillo/beta-catenin-like repeats [Plasmopara halstedii]CEG37582.1 FOG: Armadillo/beta-catenin-like repeats [Plasmopara halstedii]|eukprot:XP_024573951.1 FOG: Armadillo/beta-catenin-like repeats [Plasmopara halstedii]
MFTIDALIKSAKASESQSLTLSKKRSTSQHLTLVAAKGEINDIPYERVSEAFGFDNHPHVLNALVEGDILLRCRVLEALTTVLALPQELVIYMKYGILELVVSLIVIGLDEGKTNRSTQLSESEIKVQELSARVLSVMAMSVCAHSEILKDEIITRIKPVFAAASSKRTCEHLYHALLSSTGSFTRARRLTSAGYLSVVLDHLKSHRLNDALRICALKLLKNLVNDGTNDTTNHALELGVIAQCYKQLHSPNHEVRTASCDALAALGFMDKVRKAVVKHSEVVPRLCMLLNDKQQMVEASSAGALMTLAAHDEIKRQIVANKGLANINQLLQTKMVPLQLHTTKLVAVVAAHPEARRLLNVPATTQRLHTLIQGEDSMLAKSAQVALAAVQRQV